LCIFSNREEISAKIAIQAVATPFFEAMAWQVLPDKCPSRDVRLLSYQMPDLHCESLREQVYQISELLANDRQISVSDAELNSLFGRKDS
jgi:hypothetical protein